jgi:uracil-DNA glycosylase
MNRPSSPQNGPQADVTPRNTSSESPKSRPSSAEGDVAGSIKQLLDMYQRSGLRWYLLPDGVHVQVKDLLQRYSGAGMLSSSSPLEASSKSQPTASSIGPHAVQSSKDVAVTSTNVEPNKTIAATKTPPNKPASSTPEITRPAAAQSPATRAPIPQPSSWQLPVLTLPQREQNFTDLRKKVAACQKCPELVNHRSQTVFGDGTLQPKVCFFGEAPGADEDKQGIPFVGRAGQLLDKIIEATKLKRPDDVYILNSLRCRPPGNRTPTPDEVENCRPFFELQLEVLQPKYIVCLGAVAVRAILQSTESVGVLRGRFHAYRGAKVLVTYHPAYLLRNPDAKKLVWQDMQLLMADMGTKA